MEALVKLSCSLPELVIKMSKIAILDFLLMTAKNKSQ